MINEELVKALANAISQRDKALARCTELIEESANRMQENLTAREDALEDAKLTIETYQGSQIFDGDSARDPVGALKANMDELKTRTFLEWPSVKAGYWPEQRKKAEARHK